ncbi:MAG: VWA domain-containing protein [Vicinamibacterales bacterium]
MSSRHQLLSHTGTLVLGVCACLAASGASAGQSPTVFRSGVDLVNVGVTVVDRKGQLVTDLRREDFLVVEEGTRQTIDYFSNGLQVVLPVAGASNPGNLHVGLLFDTSGSMSEDLSFSRSAAIKFLNLLPEAEDMTLVDFDTEVRVARFSQRDFPRLVERLRNRKPEGLTALYDALGVYLDGADLDNGRKVLVLYTDGGDTGSRLGLNEIVNLLKASDVTVYAIGFLEHQSSSVRTSQRMKLQQITEVTGGQAFFPTSKEQLDEMYAKILDEIHAQYTIGYQSTNPKADGHWRTVEVRLNRPDLKGARVRARKGYFAPLLGGASQP